MYSIVRKFHEAEIAANESANKARPDPVYRLLFKGRASTTFWVRLILDSEIVGLTYRMNTGSALGNIFKIKFIGIRNSVCLVA
jgi:hypothetical protein